MSGSRRRSLAVDKLRVDELQVKDIIIGGDPLNNPVGATTPSGTRTLAGATITVGDEAANVINVAIQLTDGAGNDMAHACAVAFYLSSDEDGQVLEGSGPDAIAIGTDGVLIKDGGDSLVCGTLVSEDDGDIDLNLTHAGADSFYLNLIMPDGSIVTSDVITMDATT